MKVMHLSDLHLGKSIFERSLIDDQKYILDQIIDIIDENKVTVLMLSGDIYDKQVPSTQAVNLLDSFLTKLTKRNIKTLIIPGNHDSESRLGFGNKILENNGLIIENSYKGKLRKVVIEDVNFYLLPFIKPLNVRGYFEDVTSYNDAIKKIIEKTKINKNEKNILLTHQFYTLNGEYPELSDSELNLGGIDNVNIKLLDDFNYVAMGHIHRPQKLYKDTFRYSGSILKYSFSESKFNKSVPIIDTSDFSFDLIPLVPLRDLIDIKGTLDELLENSSDAYVRAILTDADELIDPLSKLRSKYPNLLKLEFSNKRYDYANNEVNLNSIDKKSKLDLFEEFYLLQNNVSLSEDLRDIFNSSIKEVENETD